MFALPIVVRSLGIDPLRQARPPALKVAPPGHPLEGEADRLAGRALAAPFVSYSAAPRDTEPAAAPGQTGSRAAAGGAPLELGLRHEMEGRFQHDFSQVRVHSDSAAARSAERIGAQAYTIGGDIVFGAGRFMPQSTPGRRLLAHELAHVVQQSGPGAPGLVQRQLDSLPPILLGLAAGMDTPGEYILGTYLYGGGAPHDVYDDPMWTAYMKDHEALRGQIYARLIMAVKTIADGGIKGRFPIVERFHAEFPENRGLSGYELLHGSNRDAGDFQLIGWADVADAYEPADGDYDIDLDLRYVFNDIVDPNKNYLSDRIRAVVADAVTLGQPRSYRLSIHWGSYCLAEVRQGGIEFYGYPSGRGIPIRPLPGGRLDIAKLEKKRAVEIDAAIVGQLKRHIRSDDVASLADRKGRLLWSFYRIGYYLRPTYLKRLEYPRSGDELPDLLRTRISRGLRVQLMEALKGTQPEMPEP
jgi:hypothetical protein